MKIFNKLAHEIHQNAVDKGFWDKDRNDAECIALMHSELSEALECLRNGMKPDRFHFHAGASTPKPEGVPIELAGCIIRILDYCGAHGIDMDRAIDIKMTYNRGRENKHGKEF